MKNKFKKPGDQPDLAYVSDHIFWEGREGFKRQSRNPYLSWQQDKRNDWTAGYLYEQRLQNLERAEKNKILK